MLQAVRMSRKHMACKWAELIGVANTNGAFAMFMGLATQFEA
jgi:hypothetical protein